MKLSEILRAGKANIEKRGWCQGDEKAVFGGDDRPCCMATAISMQFDMDDIQTKGWPAVEALKIAAGAPLTHGIANWNDAPERTLAEVLAAYDKAIATAEAQEQTT